MAHYICAKCGRGKRCNMSGALHKAKNNNRPLICGTCTRRIREKAAERRRGSTEAV